MSAHDILEEIAEREDWDEDTKLWVCLEYIRNQQSDDAFRDFCETRAAQDAEDE